MKRFFVILALLMCAAATVSAQENEQSVKTDETAVDIIPGMKYRNLKQIYDYHVYVPSLYDTHNPSGMGVASFFVPGLGQMLSGEFGRGLLWMGGHFASYITMGIGSALCSVEYYPYESDPGVNELYAAGVTMVLVGLTSMIAVDICSIVDAVRVAKVRNMYNHDLYKKMYSLDVDLHPSVNYIQTAAGVQPAAGLTLAFNF